MMMQIYKKGSRGSRHKRGDYWMMMIDTLIPDNGVVNWREVHLLAFGSLYVYCMGRFIPMDKVREEVGSGDYEPCFHDRKPSFPDVPLGDELRQPYHHPPRYCVCYNTCATDIIWGHRLLRHRHFSKW